MTSFSRGSTPTTVLVLENAPDARRTLGERLHRCGFTSREASSVTDGISSVGDTPVDAVVVGSGLSAQRLDVLERLRRHPSFRSVPVFVVVDDAGRDSPDAAVLRRYSADVFYATQSYDVLMKYICRIVARTNLV